jgi:rod shape-determining protein MreB
MRTPLTSVLDAITTVLRRSPPDLVADLGDRGIMLAGGSALMPGLDLMLRQATGMPVHIAPNPDTVAVRGLGAMIEGKVRPMPLDPLAA